MYLKGMSSKSMSLEVSKVASIPPSPPMNIRLRPYSSPLKGENERGGGRSFSKSPFLRGI
jgi:hypothetical protein